MSKPLPSHELYEFGSFRADIEERVLVRDQRPIPLTPKAFDTLVVLIRNRGRVVGKDTLLKEVWPETFVEEGVLAVNVAAIRKALSDGEEGPSYIETVPRRGYRFIGEVHALEKPSDAESAVQSSHRRKKSSTRTWGIAAGLLALVLAGFGWFISRPQPSSIPRPSSPVPLTSYPGAELSPSFSPDGSQVAFSWNGERQDNLDIYVKLVDRGDPLRLTQNPDPDLAPAWSPDGRHIAFVRRGSIFLISPIGGPERKLADVQATHLAWMPDGKALAVTSGKGGSFQIVLISIETGEARDLTALPRDKFYFGDIGSAISPDGLNLAFARFSTATTADLLVVPLSGGKPKLLAENRPTIWGLTWTPDGKDLVYSSGQFNTEAVLWRLRIDSAPNVKPERIEGVEEGSVEPAIASHVPRPPWRMAYERTMLDSNIWVKEPASPGSPNKVIASTRRDADPQFSPDGRQLAFASDRSGVRQIWLCDGDGSNQMQLTSFDSGFANAPRWSPDGKQIVFAAIINNNRDIYGVSSEGGALRRLTTEPTEEGRPSWSRDGRWIYFYSTRSGFNIFKMPAEGGNAVQVTTGGGHECFESPDGKLLYYQILYSGLRVIPTGKIGPQRGEVFLPTIWPGLWAVTDRGICFVELNEKGSSPYRVGGPFLFSAWVAGLLRVSHPIRFYDFESQKVTQIGVIEKELVRNLPGFSVTRDGRRIAWSQIDHAESDLMMVENFR